MRSRSGSKKENKKAVVFVLLFHRVFIFDHENFHVVRAVVARVELILRALWGDVNIRIIVDEFLVILSGGPER